MLTVLLGAAAFIALLLASDWLLEQWDHSCDRRFDRVFQLAAIRWVPRPRRPWRARLHHRPTRRSLPPITSPEEFDL